MRWLLERGGGQKHSAERKALARAGWWWEGCSGGKPAASAAAAGARWWEAVWGWRVGSTDVCDARVPWLTVDCFTYFPPSFCVARQALSDGWRGCHRHLPDIHTLRLPTPFHVNTQALPHGLGVHQRLLPQRRAPGAGALLRAAGAGRKHCLVLLLLFLNVLLSWVVNVLLGGLVE